MSAPASLSSPTAAPTGAEADWATPSTLLLLFIIRHAHPLGRGRRRLAPPAHRNHGPHRTSCAPSAPPTPRSSWHASPTACSASARSRPRSSAAPPTPTQTRSASSTAAASARSPSAPQPRGLTPPRPYPPGAHAQVAHRRTGPRHRSTPPPSQPEPTATGPVHPLTPEGHGRPRRADFPPPPRGPQAQALPTVPGPTSVNPSSKQA